MKRVVVTGLGIVSSIGNNRNEVVDSLKQGRSGITFAKVYEDLGFRSHVHGPINIDLDAFIDRKIKRFMGDGAAFNYIAMQQAIDDSGLNEIRSVKCQNRPGDGVWWSFNLKHC